MRRLYPLVVLVIIAALNFGGSFSCDSHHYDESDFNRLPGPVKDKVRDEVADRQNHANRP